MELKIEKLNLKDVKPNNWNPNNQTARQYEAELESIQEYGFIDPITVRRLDDGFEIIDGEHRYKALHELGESVIPAIILDVTEEQAKKLTIILNETRGSADQISIARVLQQIDQPIDDLIKGLPYTKFELESLLEVARRDWEDVIKKNDHKELEHILSFRFKTQDYNRVIEILKSRNKETYEEAFLDILDEVESGT